MRQERGVYTVVVRYETDRGQEWSYTNLVMHDRPSWVSLGPHGALLRPSLGRPRALEEPASGLVGPLHGPPVRSRRAPRGFQEGSRRGSILQCNFKHLEALLMPS